MMNSAKIVPIIKTTSQFGDGSKNNPYRTVTQYWDIDGNLICAKDPLFEKDVVEDIITDIRGKKTREISNCEKMKQAFKNAESQPVNIKFTGTLAQLAKILKSEILKDGE